MNTGEVRTKLVNALNGNIPAQVFTGRVVPTRVNDLPGCYVYVAGTNANGADHRNVAFTTNVSIQCDVIVAENETGYETAEGIVQAIKDVLFSDTNFHENIAAFSSYTETYSTSSLGEIQVVVISLVIGVVFVETYETGR